MRSRMVASSLTVFRATLVSSPSATSPSASPSYTIPKEPCPSSRITVIFSRDTSHSSGTYTEGGDARHRRRPRGDGDAVPAGTPPSLRTVRGAEVLGVDRGVERPAGVAVVVPARAEGWARGKKGVDKGQGERHRLPQPRISRVQPRGCRGGSLPLLVVEEDEDGEAGDEQHEHHGRDGQQDVEASRLLLGYRGHASTRFIPPQLPRASAPPDPWCSHPQSPQTPNR